MCDDLREAKKQKRDRNYRKEWLISDKNMLTSKSRSNLAKVMFFRLVSTV